MAEPRPRPGELATSLRELRRTAGLTGMEAASRAGTTQASVSRYEAAKSVPSEADLRRLLEVYGAKAGQVRRLVRLVKDWREQAHVPARVVMHRAAGGMQHRIGAVEAAAKHVRQFHPAAVLGLLQLPEYARVVFASGGDLPEDQQAAALDERMARQSILTEPGRQFALLLTEGALRWHIGSPGLMVAQIEHIAAQLDLPAVRIGVIPYTTAVELAPMNGFDIYDEAAAIVGTETGTGFLTDRGDVAMYLKLFADLEAVASFDEAARKALARVADEYRRLI